MRRKQLFWASVATLMMVSCTPRHYQLTGVERTRIIVDSRYDQNPDEAAAAFLAPYKRVNDSIMRPVMGQVAHNMHAARPESDLSNLLADILVWISKDYNEQPVLGIYNMGGIRADLTKGDVTYEDILSVAPFENTIAFVTLTGEQLMMLFRQMAVKGGDAVSKGVELVINKDRQLVSARINGQEIDPAASYRIVSLNYLVEGNDGLDAMSLGTDKVIPSDKNNNARFLIMNYFRDMQAQGVVVDAQVEGRVRIVD